ncbi:MAG: hypothetical protein QQN58_03860 [Nitrosopumilus sp.]|nr:hypothetical protein [Nitrososphaerota archaeon]MCH9041846.1 hypothetical protein [Nitrososphaerota archaeon]
MTRSRTLSVIVKKKTGDVFDAILQIPPKLIPDAKMSDDGWWSFPSLHGKARLKFNENKSLGILDHQYIDEESSWNVPMHVVASGDFSEVVITLNKPDELSDNQFDQRISEIGEMIVTMKNIIESNT